MMDRLHFELTNDHDYILKYCQSYFSGPKRREKETDYYGLVKSRRIEIEAVQVDETNSNDDYDEDEENEENEESNASSSEENIHFALGEEEDNE